MSHRAVTQKSWPCPQCGYHQENFRRIQNLYSLLQALPSCAPKAEWSKPQIPTPVTPTLKAKHGGSYAEDSTDWTGAQEGSRWAQGRFGPESQDQGPFGILRLGRWAFWNSGLASGLGLYIVHGRRRWSTIRSNVWARRFMGLGFGLAVGASGADGGEGHAWGVQRCSLGGEGLRMDNPGHATKLDPTVGNAGPAEWSHFVLALGPFTCY